ADADPGVLRHGGGGQRHPGIQDVQADRPGRENLGASPRLDGAHRPDGFFGDEGRTASASPLLPRQRVPGPGRFGADGGVFSIRSGVGGGPLAGGRCRGDRPGGGGPLRLRNLVLSTGGRTRGAGGCAPAGAGGGSRAGGAAEGTPGCPGCGGVQGAGGAAGRVSGGKELAPSPSPPERGKGPARVSSPADAFPPGGK